MKSKEIINEANWADKAKRVANVGLKIGNALIGTSGPEGFDIKKGVAKRSAKELTNKFYEILTQEAQKIANTAKGSTVAPKSVLQNLIDLIEDKLKVNPMTPYLKDELLRLAEDMTNEINNPNSLMRTNSKLKNSVYQLMVKVLQLKVSDSSDEIKSKMAVVSIGNQLTKYYFAFAGDIAKWFEYELIPNQQDEYTKVSRVTDPIIKRDIRDSDIERVSIKDMSSNKQQIKLLGTL